MASVSVTWSHGVRPDVFEASSMALSKEEDTGLHLGVTLRALVSILGLVRGIEESRSVLGLVGPLAAWRS